MRNYSCKPVVWKRRLWFRHRDIQTTRFKGLSHMRRSARCCAALVNHKKRFYQRGNAQRACERPFTYYLYKWHMTSHIHLDTFNIFIHTALYTYLPSVLWRCWLGGRKGIRPVKTEWWRAGMVICLERGADLHMAQMMPLPLAVSCFSKI